MAKHKKRLEEKRERAKRERFRLFLWLCVLLAPLALTVDLTMIYGLRQWPERHFLIADAFLEGITSAATFAFVWPLMFRLLRPLDRIGK